MGSRDNGTRRFNVLTIDGGPAAFLQARLLLMLEKSAPGFLAATDIFAGTSYGTLLSFFLASRVPAKGSTPTPTHEQACAILSDAIAFQNATLGALNASAFGILGAVSGMGPLNRIPPLQDTLVDAIGDMRLCELQRGVVATSFDMNAWRPHVFHWFPENMGKTAAGVPDWGRSSPREIDPSPRATGAVRDDSAPAPALDKDLPLTDVMLASSSLPLAISTYGDRFGRHFLDGAIIANNPSMIAVSRILEVFAGRPAFDAVQPREEDDAAMRPVPEAQLQRLRVLSLGTNSCSSEEQSVMQGHWLLGWLSEVLGFSPSSPGNLPWGWIQWIWNRPMLLPDLLYEGQNQVVAEECAAILGHRSHYRYAPEMEVLTTLRQGLLGRPEKLIRSMDELATQLWSLPESQMLVRYVKTNWLGRDGDGQQSKR